MGGNDDTTRAPTRREYVKYGGALVGTTLAAGCLDGGGPSGAEPPATESEGATATATPTSTETATETEAAAETSYTVSMAPAGDVTFDAVPERWMSYFSTYGDMGIALGQADGLAAAVFTANWPLQLYDALPGVEVSLDGVEQLWADGGLPKERFYEVDADVHLTDPNFLLQLDDNWDDADLAEIRENVGPIVGNWIRRRNFDWHDYDYYSLYEAFEVVAEVFQERARYEALKTVHDEFVDELDERLPQPDERPEIGLLSVNDDFEAGVFSLYQVDAGNGKKQYQDLGINDAFADLDPDNTNDADYELLLEQDPDILVLHFAASHATEADVQRKREILRDDSLGSQLTAVQNDRIYPGGTAYQGPIINLLQTEMAAKQFYPDVFGAWEGYETLADESNWLFDHRRVADVVTGAFQE